MQFLVARSSKGHFNFPSFVAKRLTFRDYQAVTIVLNV